MYIISKRTDGRYQIKKENSKRASKIFDTKEEAISYCKDKGYEYKTESSITSVVKSSKSNKLPKVIAILLSIIVVLLIVIICLDYFKVVNIGIVNFIENYIIVNIGKENEDDNNSNENNGSDGDYTYNNDTLVGITYDDFQIHFLELGNDYSGDSIYIKAGDVDILIDAGSRTGSASTIKSYLDNYVTDGVLEYVIATHGDQDHIAGFVGSNKSGILYQYEVGTIILNELTTKTTTIYSNFLDAVSYCEDNGTTVYYAADCYNNASGASRTYVLDEELNITMDILYNYYYFNTSSDENNYSVCTMFSYNEHYYMFTGDLELEGEEAMAEYYDGSSEEKTLPEVDLFKAGHHGSKTSTNECLLEIIKPDIVCVTCCAGGSEYTANYLNTFPTQDFIDRVAKYTDQIYVTSYYDEVELTRKSLNGNIIVSSDGKNVAVSASNNVTKLKDTEWFNETVYVDSSNYICSRKGKSDYFTADSDGVIAVPRRTWPS